MLFHSVSAPIGSRKTTSAINFTGHGAVAGERFFIAQPTTRLCDQSYADFRNRFPDVRATVIHSGTVDNVATAIQQASEQSSSGEVIFCTHTGLLQSAYIANKDEWHLIIDETPQPIWCADFSLPRNDNAARILSVVDAVEPNGKYSKITPLDDGTLMDIAKDKGVNGVWSSQFQDLARKLRSGHWDVYVLTEQWNKLKNKRKGDGNLSMFGLLDVRAFDGFASATIMGANLEDSLFHKVAANSGCTFRPHRAIRKQLLFTEHQHGERLTVYYAIDANWSKTLRDKTIDVDGEEFTLNQIIVAGAKEVFGDEPFAKSYNKDLITDPFDNLGTMLPHVSHGRNDFQYLYNVAVLPALNPTSAFYTFLSDVGSLKPDEVKRAVYNEQVHQAIGRCSLRNLDDQTLVNAVVADRVAAEYEAKLRPGTKIAKLPFANVIQLHPKNPGGRPNVHETPEAKAAAKKYQDALAARRSRWRTKNASEITLSYKGVISDGNAPVEATAGFAISIWDSRAVRFHPYEDFEPQHQNHLIRQQQYGTEDFFAYMKKCYDFDWAATKYENYLFAPSIFDLSKDPGKGHTKANHVFTQGIVLDIEDKETHNALTPEEIRKVLPCRMAAFSSFSHTASDRRYRIVIPTAPMSYDASEAIRRMCVAKLNEAYPGRHHIDLSKLNAVSLFFLPSMREDSFFTTYDGPILDHQDWVKKCPHNIVDKVMSVSHHSEPLPLPEPANIVPINTAPPDETKIEMALATWRNRSPGTSNDALYRLGWRLHGYRMSIKEIRTTLTTEAQMFGGQSSADLIRQVPRIVKDIETRANRGIG